MYSLFEIASVLRFVSQELATMESLHKTIV